MGVKYVSLGADDAVVAIAHSAEVEDDDAVEEPDAPDTDSNSEGDGL